RTGTTDHAFCDAAEPGLRQRAELRDQDRRRAARGSAGTTLSRRAPSPRSSSARSGTAALSQCPARPGTAAGARPARGLGDPPPSAWGDAAPQRRPVGVPGEHRAARRLELPGGRRRLLPPPAALGDAPADRPINAEGRPAVLYLHPWEMDP